MKVVVTGGAGFIGANVVRRLLEAPWVDEVAVLDDLSTGREDNLRGLTGVALSVGSILDDRLLREVCAGASAIIHLAARASVPESIDDPMGYHETNATGTLQVLEAARAASDAHVVVASSSAVYGDDPTMPKHEALPTVPLSPYAATKLAAEGYALAHGASYGLPVLAFRFFNVYGPLQPPGHVYAAVIPAFIDAALQGRPLTVHGDGGQTRDFVFVGTVAEHIVDAVERRVTHDRPLNLAAGVHHDLLSVIALLEGALGRQLPRTHTPVRPGDVRHSEADHQRLRQLFPSLTPVGLAEGLKETVDWFRTLPQYR